MKRMFDSKRWLSTVIYLASIVLTLVSAWKLHSVILCLVFIIIQFLALIW